ncbi:MAG: FAD-dependent oxidoreductase [Pseudomonadales bacterium]|nr:FAD-dependent oxidoreductase [Pseudomonadales bacterium]
MDNHHKKAPLNKETDRIAVVGAGPSGIVCARELAKKGWKNVVLFEAQNQLGGKTKSVSIDHTDNVSDPRETFEKTFAEMGTQTILDGPVMKDILKETGLDKQLYNQPRGRVRNLSDSRDYHPLFAPLPQPISLYEKISESLKFTREIDKIKMLNQPGFRDLSGSSLSVSLEEWFEQNNFVFSKYMSLPFISTGLCGMHYDRVPVAYMIKLQKIIFRLPLWRKALLINSRVTLGNNELWRRAASGLDIRYEQTIKHIQTDSDKINITTGSQENFSFDRLIWTGRLPSLGKALGDSNAVIPSAATSRNIYSKVQYLRRAVFVYRVDGLPRDIAWVHSDDILRKDSGSPFVTINLKGTNCYYFYPWLSNHQTTDDVDRKIREFVTKLGGNVLSMATDPMYWDYNPFFEGDLIEQGVFDDIESDQGKDGIYICGETLSGVTLPAVSEYAKDLIERHF